MKKFLVWIMMLSLAGLCIIITGAFFAGDTSQEYLQERFWYLIGCLSSTFFSLIILIARYSHSEEYYRQINRWLALWYRFGAKWEWDKYKAFLDILDCYREPHRIYHAFAHIEYCLKELDQVRHLAKNPDVVEMALWYHDAIYDTKAKDNEEKSVELAVSVAGDAGLAKSFCSELTNLILATKHDAVPADPDAQLLVDIDLSILGQPEEKFDEYERQIRKEYEWVPDDVFAAGRSAILKSFLKRPTIYSTEFFRNKYEDVAQRNLKRSLRKLEKI